ncbi:ferrous iron transporter B, partial [bacterium]|nr:ferrous iron transporter B [bacterium]
RAAFVMDKFFHIFGLHGRSFIPFMIATGCAVPAVMSARNLVNPRDRKITVLVIPLLICGAKSPVVAMLAAAFFPATAGLIFWLVWASGWFLAFVIALIFRKTIFRGDAAPFVMELPPYRMPTIRGIFSHMWDKSFAYVRKAGTIILAISIIIWFLLSFPKLPASEFQYSERAEKIEQDYLAQLDGDVTVGGNERNELEADYKQAISNLDDEFASKMILFSYAGRVGKFIEPVLKPAGFDWKIGIGLFGGLAAKEVIISTMGIVYGIGDADPDEESGVHVNTPLKSILASDPHYNKAVALSLMFFVLIYVPCAATLAVVRKELGSWKWSAFLAGYTLIVAWLVSTAIYQFATLLGW